MLSKGMQKVDKTNLFDRNTELAKKICELLRKKGKKVASAESCTGGLLATFLTELPGSSLVYQGGISCYSNLSKSKVLSIPMSTFESAGAVSKEVATELAKNVRSLLDADFGIGVTGIAGPDGGSVSKPVGTVWCAISGEDADKVWCLNLKGDRSSIRQQAAENVLSEFLQILKKG